ncbi:segregation/condensation protein A [Vagococcus carniphilus]|uniref:Segregation and condensation protein A n=1 Tax=Vagococcus carniphilus TaxID=218144 RepID=A0AAW8U2C9_9ENTE|nr:segregation/condensation protein A [Vagococcus carniphilus]MDT2829593.1 segregation/condensation protein A [Vagococcus carniphilus]MDT2833705.1 segregation/condensation protein A [Vagococcus carniphilus]MDT2839052.1 segregation/condensation protein A [Vagococcus carniphilus]MDT2853110.1 segregation/condensation protein A [Vagococcus carniphilus]MDT2864726.1 segregation/condensation protein A [Vagococcus carniphilus]
MKELNVKLEIFEGPLDLLLHLIKTLEIDIYDIPISEITEQYMIYIRSMKELDLELAGEYIVMAATLMAIKSKTLLPKVELEYSDDSEFADEIDPREQLVAQLLEYRKYKYAAGVLKEKETERGKYYTKEATDLSNYKEEVIPLEPNEITTIDLFLAFSDIMNRQRELGPDSASIISEEFTIEDKVKEIMTKMFYADKKDGMAFESLFYLYTRNEIVTTFMALLELIKSGEIIAKQARAEEPIVLYRKNEG